MDQLQDNLAAIDLEFTDAEMRQLDEASALHPEYPGWMLTTQGADRLGPADLWSKSAASAAENLPHDDASFCRANNLPRAQNR